jgi:hypothetical protein
MNVPEKRDLLHNLPGEIYPCAVSLSSCELLVEYYTRGVSFTSTAFVRGLKLIYSAASIKEDGVS